MNDEKLDEMIDLYLLCQMTERERDSFESAIKTDPNLAEQVALMKVIQSSLERREMKVAKMKLWQYKVTPSNIKTDKVNRLRLMREHWIGIFCVAASILLSVVFFHPYSYKGLLDRFLIAEIENSEQIYGFWNCGEYDKALALIGDMERTISITFNHEPSSEKLYELEWLKIQTLLRKREYTNAMSAVFVYKEVSGRHQDKAQKLYKRLKIKNSFI